MDDLAPEAEQKSIPLSAKRIIVNVSLRDMLVAIFIICLVLLIPYIYSSINVGINIADIKMASTLDDQLMPVNVASVFPRDTNQVYCWIEWHNAKPKSPIEITAIWRYLTDEIIITSYNFYIPRKNGSGGISLTMPGKKAFPVGTYRVDIMRQNHKIKSITFKVK